MQKPAWVAGFPIIKSLTIQPCAHAFLALDAKIIARQCVILAVAPPFHGDALRPFGCDHLVQYMPPAKTYRRAIRHFGNSFNRFRPAEQAEWPHRGKAVLLD